MSAPAPAEASVTSLSVSTATAPINVPRKRLLSLGEGGESSAGPILRKRPRMSSISMGFQNSLRGVSPSLVNPSTLDRLPRTRPIHRSELDFDFLSSRSFSSSSHYGHGHARPLSSSSSFTSASRAGSPGHGEGDAPGSSAFISREGMALMRSVSSASLASNTSNTPTYPECSAKHYMRNTRITIDFSMPPVVADPGASVGADDINNGLALAPLLSCSADNVLFFSRGNRVHYKNIGGMSGAEEIGQLCRLQDTHGDLRVIECAGKEMGDVLAIGTSKGLIQLWDVRTKKKTASWSTKSVTAMRWNGPVLTIGGAKGTIRHYDTRIAPTVKMKEQSRKVTRHQMEITSLEWNVDGKILASGDASGIVYCWDAREKVPMDVGEFIQRRKKMQHPGAISALAFCPWQPRLLATGDVEGVMQVWNINPLVRHSNATTPGKLELGAPITSIHFSPHCKEILTTHGTKPSSPPPGSATASTRSTPVPSTPTMGLFNPIGPLSWPRISMDNVIAVHSYPSLRHVTKLSLPENKAIGRSLLNAGGTRIVVAVPEDGKMSVCDVWAKRKEVKRQPSFLGATIR
ncbi:hypothetical protein H0H87_007373 [Tephrocybe sp. NHM501043]|nr:hypothetical protein H0H87_007373 [Tephrocybe sp. NHM501043]